MLFIQHRRNTIELLRETSREYGVEVDIRSRGAELIIHHDPFEDGESFDAWMDSYNHKTLILNVKEEGLEDRLLYEMDRREFDDFFFLDQSFPFLIKSSASGETRSAVRVSEFEGLESACNLAGRVEWVWVDCFTKFPLSDAQTLRLRELGFKLCIVSPELQGRAPEGEIEGILQHFRALTIEPDAVCTKNPRLWMKLQEQML